MGKVLDPNDFAPYTKCKNLQTVINRMCGPLLGCGQYRNVYLLKRNTDYVVKIERDMSLGIFANVTEWRNYIENRDWKLVGPWLAPIEIIAESGNLLIQRRLYWDGRLSRHYPKQVPVVFTDLKRVNFGWSSEGKFMCCDYSFMVSPMAVKKMKTAKWRGPIPSVKY